MNETATDGLDIGLLALILVGQTASKHGAEHDTMMAESFLAIVALTLAMIVGLAAVAKLLFGE